MPRMFSGQEKSGTKFFDSVQFWPTIVFTSGTWFQNIFPNTYTNRVTKLSRSIRIRYGGYRGLASRIIGHPGFQFQVGCTLASHVRPATVVELQLGLVVHDRERLDHCLATT